MSQVQHEELIKGLARLEEGQTHILAHLAKINGSVAHLYEEVNITKRAILEHALDCPLKGRLDLIDAQLLSGDHPGSVKVNERLNALEQKEQAVCAAGIARREWLEWLRPLLMSVLVVIAVLALAHARIILPAIGK
jgi:hypothetical protein